MRYVSTRGRAAELGFCDALLAGLATDGGLYVSIDAGNTSMQWTNNLPKSIPIHDIAIHARDNEIILGTHGRSIYIAKLADVQKLLTNPNYTETKQETNQSEIKK